ncbi:MAG: hypothetical protein AAF555_06045 [Verrucomicrobiota bacterium]
MKKKKPLLPLLLMLLPLGIILSVAYTAYQATQPSEQEIPGYRVSGQDVSKLPDSDSTEDYLDKLHGPLLGNRHLGDAEARQRLLRTQRFLEGSVGFGNMDYQPEKIAVDEELASLLLVIPGEKQTAGAILVSVAFDNPPGQDLLSDAASVTLLLETAHSLAGPIPPRTVYLAFLADDEELARVDALIRRREDLPLWQHLHYLGERSPPSTMPPEVTLRRHTFPGDAGQEVTPLVQLAINLRQELMTTR